MRILSWNLNGLMAKIRNHNLEQLKHLEPVDIFCFQEIRTKERPVIFREYHHYWYPATEKKGYSGTMTMTMVKPDNVIYGLGVESLDKEGRVLTVDMGNFYVVNVYVPNSQRNPDREDYRREWDEAFRTFILSLMDEKAVIICGDFNATMSREDIYEENTRMDFAELGYMSDERAGLYTLIENGFTDAFRYLYPNARNPFTWWANRNNKRLEDKGWRLDYFFVSEEIVEKLDYVNIHQEILGSDHCPIVLCCNIVDKTYDTQYAEAMRRKEQHEEEEKKLTRRWAYRKSRLKDYQEKLAVKQAELTANVRIHNIDAVQKLVIKMLDDTGFKCLAVEKVTNDSAPPGTDDVKWKTDADRMRAVDNFEWRDFKASPMRIIEIKNKASGKTRRSGILTYRDKAMSVLLHYIFSPIEEAYADWNSFAFRPGRTRQDMVITAANLFTGFDSPELFVYLDVKGCYSNLQHKWIMNHVPLPKNLLETLLKTGQIFEGELFPPSDHGISEGSPLSPDIANFALDG
ncbi:MAG: exodeoxyribonuclease III, partial [Lachnospiraceae bacterium]|nr:exodeoxyribonuclease III [Lachnospiraceae bacterium]